MQIYIVELALNVQSSQFGGVLYQWPPLVNAAHVAVVGDEGTESCKKLDVPLFVCESSLIVYCTFWTYPRRYGDVA